MARYTCPSCGRRYNGRHCSNCLYDNFAEEYTHGSHTHTGEPLVIREPQRKPIPRKDPFECEKTTRKTKTGSRRAVCIVLILLLLGWAALGIARQFSVSQVVRIHPVETAAPALDFPSDGMTLYDDGELRVVADWEESRKYEDGIRIVAENNTQRDLNVVTSEILVNNYVMDPSSLFLPVEAGHTAAGWLTLDSTDLECAEIEDIQQISAIFEAYDSDSYETLARTEYITLCSTGSLNQPLADGGELLYDQDGIRLVCKGCVPSSYAPDEFTEGDYLFYLENRTDTAVDIYTEEVTVNGQETYLSLYCSLPPNTQAVQRMYLFGLDDKALNLQTREDVTEMLASFNFRLADSGKTLTTGALSIPFQLDWTK